MFWMWLLACANDEDKPPEVCDFAAPAVLADGFVGGTEGAAFSPDGRLFVSGSDTVYELDDSGAIVEQTAVEGALGLAWWRDQLVVASSDGVTLVKNGKATVFATGLSNVPNFVAVTPWDTLLVSDDYTTDVVEVDGRGRVKKWLDIPSPNGLVFVDGDLWVATTFETPAPVWRVPVSDGQPGTPEAVVEYPGGNVPDGLAADVHGDVYVALNIAGRIERVAANGDTELVGEVPFTASLALDPRQPCRMVSTSLFGTEVWVMEPGD